MTNPSDTVPVMDEALAEEDFNPIVDALVMDDLDLRKVMDDIHPADFSDYFEQLPPEQREEFITRAGDLISADVLAELEDEVVEDILPLLPSDQIASAITELDNDDATQIFEEMEDEQREEILEVLEPEDRAALEASLAFDDETIGRLMQREFVAAPPFWSIGDTIDHMRATGEDLPELFFNIFNGLRVRSILENGPSENTRYAIELLNFRYRVRGNAETGTCRERTNRSINGIRVRGHVRTDRNLRYLQHHVPLTLCQWPTELAPGMPDATYCRHHCNTWVLFHTDRVHRTTAIRFHPTMQRQTCPVIL